MGSTSGFRRQTVVLYCVECDREIGTLPVKAVHCDVCNEYLHSDGNCSAKHDCTPYESTTQSRLLL